jgi:hypothetical protein
MGSLHTQGSRTEASVRGVALGGVGTPDVEHTEVTFVAIAMLRCRGWGAVV